MATNAVGAASGGAQNVQMTRQVAQTAKPHQGKAKTVAPVQQRKPARAANLQPHIGGKLDVRA